MRNARYPVAESRVIHDDIEPPERVHRRLHSGIGGTLICYVEGSGANPISILLYQIFEAARHCKHLQDVSFFLHT
jgi:hypothetical protein